jgi:hypothetical protein
LGRSLRHSCFPGGSVHESEQTVRLGSPGRIYGGKVGTSLRPSGRLSPRLLRRVNPLCFVQPGPGIPGPVVIQSLRPVVTWTDDQGAF